MTSREAYLAMKQACRNYYVEGRNDYHSRYETTLYLGAMDDCEVEVWYIAVPEEAPSFESPGSTAEVEVQKVWLNIEGVMVDIYPALPEADISALVQEICEEN